MKTIYRSEIMNKDFETVEALELAEAKYMEEHKAELEAKEARKKEAEELDALLKEYADLEKECKAKLKELANKINEKLKAFCKKYGTFRTSLTSIPSLDLFDMFFSDFYNFFK